MAMRNFVRDLDSLETAMQENDSKVALPNLRLAPTELFEKIKFLY